MSDARVPYLAALEKKVLWLATWTIHNANHLRESGDGLKVGGHQASSASLATIMTALYFAVLRPEDRVAVKPHASPIFHAIQYLLGNQTPREAREFPRLQGRAELSLAHQGHRRRRFLDRLGRPRRGADAVRRRWCRIMCARTGWADDGPKAAWWRWSAMPRWTRATSSRRCWKAGSTACAMPGGSSTTTARASTRSVREGLWERFEAIFRNFGWDVVILKYGALQRGGLRRARRRAAARLDRRLPEPALFGADLPGRRGLAQAPAATSSATRGR